MRTLEQNRFMMIEYEELEYCPDIKTSVTDIDIVNIYINIALDTQNRYMFHTLSDELKQTNESGDIELTIQMDSAKRLGKNVKEGGYILADMIYNLADKVRREYGEQS